MNVKTPKYSCKNLLTALILCFLLWIQGLGSYSSLAHHNDPIDTPTLEFVETSFSETPTPTADNTESITPSPSASVTQQETETAFPLTPTFTSTLETLSQIGGDYIPDEIVVRFKPRIGSALITNCLASIKNSVLTAQIEIFNIRILKVPEGNVPQTLTQVINCPGVAYAEPNYIVYADDTIPNDPNFGNEYGLVNIRAPQGWDLSTGSSTVTIAIIDTGVDLSHPDLAGKIVGGYDFVNNDSVAQDDNGHGTHVAGIAAAISNNHSGIAGVSWGARIMPIKALNALANGSYANVAAGIVLATDQGAQIINLSLGGGSPSLILQDAVDYALSKGVILVASVGNSGNTSILYPAKYPQVIAVGAVDSTNNRAGTSNYGPELDMVAPGVSIYSSVIGGYDYKSGTSMAAPFVSGLAAILRGYSADYSPDTIAWAIQSTALDLGAPGWDEFYGFGLIQVDRAIYSVLPPTPTEVELPGVTGKQTKTTTVSIIPISTSTTLLTTTNTLTATPTPTSSFTTYTTTPTVTPILIEITSPLSSDTPTAEFKSLHASVDNDEKNSYAQPCIGVMLIFLGLALMQLIIRWQRKNFSSNGKN